MLVFPPSSLSGALGAILSAAIVVFSLIGMTLHPDFYAGICRRDYWAYYTNQSNLLVFLYFALLAPILYGNAALKEMIPHAEYAVMLSILTTHLVFHHFLAPFVKAPTAYAPYAPDPRIAHADSIIQHYIVPLLTAAYWLLCSPGKSQLCAADGVLWLLFPIGYAVFILLRARVRGVIHHTRSAYPYPFLDVSFFGARRVTKLCGILILLGAAGGMTGVALVRGICFFLPGSAK